MRFREFFSAVSGKPLLMRGAVKEYCFSENHRRAGEAVVRQHMEARKNILRGTWGVYMRSDALLRPVGYRQHNSSPLAARIFGPVNGAEKLFDDRRGRYKKIDKGLSLQQAFEKLDTFERAQEKSRLVTRHGAADELGVQMDIPARDPHYWRNVKARMVG